MKKFGGWWLVDGFGDATSVAYVYVVVIRRMV